MVRRTQASRVSCTTVGLATLSVGTSYSGESCTLVRLSDWRLDTWPSLLFRTSFGLATVSVGTSYSDESCTLYDFRIGDCRLGPVFYFVHFFGDW